MIWLSGCVTTDCPPLDRAPLSQGTRVRFARGVQGGRTCGVVGNGAGVDHIAPRSGQWSPTSGKDHPCSIATTFRSGRGWSVRVVRDSSVNVEDLPLLLQREVATVFQCGVARAPQGQAAGRYAWGRACVEVVRVDTDDDVGSPGLLAAMSLRNGQTIEESGQICCRMRARRLSSHVWKQAATKWKRQFGEIARL